MDAAAESPFPDRSPSAGSKSSAGSSPSALSSSGESAPLAAGLGAAVVIGLLVGVAATMGRRLWFFSDDWNVLVEYHDGNLLVPFNGHLSTLPAGLYQVLFHTVGLGSYLPYRICGLAALVLLGFQVTRYSIARVPTAVAILAVAAVMWNSYGSTNVLFPFLMNFSIPIAAIVAIWWHLDKETRGHDVAAGVWLAVALATSGLGVMTLAAVVIELALKRAPLRRWAVFAPATLLWGLWWITHRESNEISGDLLGVAEYALRMFWGGTTALAAGNRVGGLVLAAGFVALTVLAVKQGTFGPRAVGALGAALAFVGLTAVTRLDVVPAIPPDELRYGWTVGAYLVLAAVSMWPASLPRVTMPRWVAPAAVAVAGGVMALGAWRLVEGMDLWADQVADAAPGLRSVLYATEAAGPRRVDPEIVLPLSFVPVTTGAYIDAVDDVGSPLQGADLDEIGGRPDQREAAERVFFDRVKPVLGSSPTTEDLPLEQCSQTSTGSPGETLLVVPSAQTESAESSAIVSVGRFAASPSEQLEGAGDARWLLELPFDAPVGTDAVVPYVIQVDPGHMTCPS
jgi:hypothetical protein